MIKDPNKDFVHKSDKISSYEDNSLPPGKSYRNHYYDYTKHDSMSENEHHFGE